MRKNLITSIFMNIEIQEAHNQKLQAKYAQAAQELVRYEESHWLCYVRGPEGSATHIRFDLRGSLLSLATVPAGDFR